MGEWWAQHLLRAVIEVDDIGATRLEASDSVRAGLERKAGDFALILADLSRSNGSRHISSHYVPDRTLRSAANMALVPAYISPKSYTDINDRGVVTAKAGGTGEIMQIWPPVAESVLPG